MIGKNSNVRRFELVFALIEDRPSAGCTPKMAGKAGEHAMALMCSGAKDSLALEMLNDVLRTADMADSERAFFCHSSKRPG